MKEGAGERGEVRWEGLSERSKGEKGWEREGKKLTNFIR